MGIYAIIRYMVSCGYSIYSIKMIRTFLQILFLLLRNKQIFHKNVTAQSANPSALQQIRQTYNVVKQMDLFRKQYGDECRWCGGKKDIQIHHIIPLWADITKAAQFENFIALCRRCHFTIGHFNSFAKRYNPSIVLVCDEKQLKNRDVL